MTRIRVHSCIDNIKIPQQQEILSEGGIDARHGLWLLAGLVDTTLRVHGRDLLTIAEDVQNRPFAGVVWIVLLCVGLAYERVRTNRHFVAKGQLLLGLLIESAAQDPDRNQRNTEVHDVSAIAACVAMAEVHHRPEQTLPCMTGNNSTATDEFGSYSEDDECGKDGGHR